MYAFYVTLEEVQYIPSKSYMKIMWYNNDTILI